MQRVKDAMSENRRCQRGPHHSPPLPPLTEGRARRWRRTGSGLQRASLRSPRAGRACARARARRARGGRRRAWMHLCRRTSAPRPRPRPRRRCYRCCCLPSPRPRRRPCAPKAGASRGTNSSNSPTLVHFRAHLTEKVAPVLSPVARYYSTSAGGGDGGGALVGSEAPVAALGHDWAAEVGPRGPRTQRLRSLLSRGPLSRSLSRQASCLKDVGGCAAGRHQRIAARAGR